MGCPGAGGLAKLDSSHSPGHKRAWGVQAKLQAAAVGAISEGASEKDDDEDDEDDDDDGVDLLAGLDTLVV